ncbi:MAG: phosphatase PAP2 family protein [Thermoplasmatota archaeon]
MEACSLSGSLVKAALDRDPCTFSSGLHSFSLMRRAQRWMLGALLIGLTAFAVVAADEAVGGPLERSNTPVNDAVSRWQNAGFPAHAIGNVLTQIGALWFVIIAVGAGAAWMLWKRQWIMAAWSVGIAVSTSLVVTGLKYLFQRARPGNNGALGYSFPSGHALAATAALGATIILTAEVHRRTRGKGPHMLGTRAEWAVALCLWGMVAVLTGIGRVLVQEHWLSDVIASWALGLALVSGILLTLSRAAPAGDTGPKVPEPKSTATK